MYKIYKTKSKLNNMIYYVLCVEDNVICRFYATRPRNNWISDIHEINHPISFTDMFDLYISKCIYESFNLQEAKNQLEQLWILESV